jgi:hypothetical protein
MMTRRTPSTIMLPLVLALALALVLVMLVLRLAWARAAVPEDRECHSSLGETFTAAWAWLPARPSGGAHARGARCVR